MNSSLVITTINSPNQNIKLFSKGCKKNKWNLIIIGDKKSAILIEYIGAFEKAISKNKQ